MGTKEVCYVSISRLHGAARNQSLREIETYHEKSARSKTPACIGLSLLSHLVTTGASSRTSSTARISRVSLAWFFALINLTGFAF